MNKLRNLTTTGCFFKFFRLPVVICVSTFLLLTGCSFNLEVTEESSVSIPAKSLKITQQPGATYVAGVAFSPEIQISYLDESGNLDPLANRPVSVEFANNSTSAILGGTLSANPTAGLTKFNDLKITKAGTGYTLKFFNGDGLFEVSQSFDVVAAAADRIDISSTPLVFNASACSSSPLTFNIVDEFGNSTALDQNKNISLSASQLQFYSDASCSTPITQVNLSTGDQGGQFYVSGTVAGSHIVTLTAPDLDLDNQSVTVQASATGVLAFTTPPKTVTAGVCSSAIVVSSQDNFGNANTVSVDTTVNLSGTGLQFYTDATCSTPAISNLMMSSGTGNLSFYIKGTTAGSIPLTASATGMTSGVQNQNIIPDVVTGLSFKVQPSNTAAGVAISPAVEVQLIDQFGNIASTSSKVVSLDIGTNPSGTAVIVGGPRSVSTVNGVAIFSGAQDIVIQKADVGYTLVASAPGIVGSVASQSFDILGGPIASLEYIPSLGQTLVAGACSAQVQIHGKDQYGNTARASVATVLSVTGSGLSIYSDNACGTTALSSVSIPMGSSQTSFYFKGIVAGDPIVKTASVTSGDGAADITQNHKITPAAPQAVSFISSAQTIVAGECSGKVEFKVGDIYGNPVPPVADSTLNLAANDGATQFFANASDCASGSSTTSTVLISQSGNSGSFYFKSTKSGISDVTVSGTVDFVSGSNVAVSGTQSNTIVHAAPHHMDFLVQPTNTIAGVFINPAVEVAVKDIFNNICTSYSTAINLNIEDNPSGSATLQGGAKALIPTNGISKFDGALAIAITKADSAYTLAATSGTLPNLESNAFNIAPAAPQKYKYTQDPPANVTAGNCSATSFKIQTLDAFGNVSPVVGAKALSLSASPSGPGQVQFYSDNTCTTSAPGVLPDNESELELYVKGQRAGSNTITVGIASLTCDAANGCPTVNSRTFTIDPDAAYQLAFSTAPIVSPNQVEAGSCSPLITLISTDQFGNQVAVSGDQTIALTPVVGTTYYHDSSCTDEIGDAGDPLKISSANSSTSFAFKTELLGSGQHTTTVTSTFTGIYAGGTASPHTSVVSQVNAMKAAPPDRFAILQQPLDSIAGQTIQGPFTAELRDRFGNPANTSTAKTYVYITDFSPATRPTLYGAGLTSATTPTNPGGQNYFPSTPVQSLWSFAVAGQVIYTGALGINIQKVGTYKLGMSVLGITFAPTSESVSFNITHAPATKLAFSTSPLTTTAGVCSGAVVVQAQDNYSNAAKVTQNTTVTPSGTGMTFYSSGDCAAGNAITSVDMGLNTDSVTFYYKGTVAGTQPLLVQATSGDSLTQTSQNQIINPDVPVKLAFSTPARTTPAGACSAIITVNSRDQFNNNSPLASSSLISFSQTGTSSVQYFSDSGCTTSISDVTMNSGSFTSNFYVKGSVSGTIDLTVTPDFANPVGAATQTQTIIAAALSKITFLQHGSLTLTAGQCSAAVTGGQPTTFELRDAFDNAKLGGPTTVKFDSSQAGFEIFSDSNCTTQIPLATGILVGAGTSQGSFYFRSTVAGLPRNLIASVSSPAVSQTQVQSINPAGFSKFAFTNGTSTITSSTVTAGTCNFVKVQAQDEFGNIVDSNLANQRVILESSDSNTGFFQDAGCATPVLVTDATDSGMGSPGPHPNKSFVMITAAKEVGVYLKNNVKSTPTLSALHSGVANNGVLNLTVNPAAATKLAFVPNLIDSTAGSALQATGPSSVKVEIQDQFGNLTAATGAVTIALDPVNANNVPATLSGTLSLAAIAGTAAFPTALIEKSGVGYTLKATSTGLTAGISNSFNVIAAAPTQLSITSPTQTVIAGQCSGAATPGGASTATLLDQYGNISSAQGDTVIDLSGTNVTFYSDPSCTTPLPGGATPQLTIVNGQPSANFYFMPTLSGTIAINAERTNAPVLNAGTQNQTVLAGPPSKIGFGTPVRNDIIAGVCAGAGKVIEVEVQDTYGNRAINTTGSALTLSYTGIGAQTKIFSDASCTTELSKPVTDYQNSIASNGSFVSLYLQDNEAHAFTLTASESVNSWTANQAVTIIAGTPVKLSFTNSPITGLVAGTCSGALIIESQDSLNNASNVAVNKVVTLASDASMSFYSSLGCGGGAISSVNIGSGTASTTIYFKTTLAGDHLVTVSTAGMTSATQTENVIADGVNKLGFYQQPTNTVAGNTISPAVRVDALDQYGNLVSGFSGAIDLSKGASPGGGVLSGTLTQTANLGSALFSNLSIDLANSGYTLEASSSGLISATSNTFNITSAAPASLFFASAAQTLDVQNCSAATVVGLKDSFGNETTTSSSLTVGLSANGFTFYSDSTCSSIITDFAISAGQAQGQFWFKSNKAGAIPLTASSGTLVSAIQTETIIPGVPTKLAFTGSGQTVRSGECSAAVTIEAQDTLNNATAVSTATTIQLLGLNFDFFTDSTCSTPATSALINNGSSSVQVWYKGQAVGASSILATATGLVATPAQAQTVVPGFAAKLKFSTAGRTLMTNECSTAASTKFHTLDVNGNETTVEAPVTIDLTPTSGLLFYSDSNCTALISSTTITPNSPVAGRSEGSFYFKTGNNVGNADTKIEVYSTSSIDADRFKPNGDDTLQHTVVARPPSQLAFTVGDGQSVRVGNCSAAVTVRTEDSLGNPSAVTAPTSIQLSSAATVTYYSDSLCTSILPSSALSLGTGVGSASFYFKIFATGPLAVTATATLEGSSVNDVANFTITPAAAAKIVYTAKPTDFVAGIKVDECYAHYDAVIKDRFDNISNTDVDLDFVLSSINANYYLDANCTQPILAQPPLVDRKLVVATGSSALPRFYMKTSSLGLDSTVLSSNSGVENAFHSFVAYPNIAVNLSFETSAKNMTAGFCSEKIEFTTKDRLNYETTVSSPLNVGIKFVDSIEFQDLTPAQIADGNYGIYFDEDCLNPITQFQIPINDSKGFFYIRSTKAGPISYQISATDTVSEPDIVFAPQRHSITVNPDKTTSVKIASYSANIGTNRCSSPFVVQFLDVHGNLTIPYNPNVFPSSTATDVLFYKDANCSQQIVSNFEWGKDGIYEFYLKKVSEEDTTIKVSVPWAWYTTLSHQVNVSFKSSGLKRLAVINPPRVGYNFCSAAFTLQSQDANGNPEPVTEAGGIDFTLGAAGTSFYTSSDCSAGSMVPPGGQVHMNQGVSDQTMYLKLAGLDGRLTKNLINPNVLGRESIGAFFEVLHLNSALPQNALSNFEIRSGSSLTTYAQLANQLMQERCTLWKPTYHGPRFAYPLAVSLNGSTGIDFFSNNACTIPLAGSMTVNPIAGDTSVRDFSVWVKSTVAGDGQVTFTEPHLNFGIVPVKTLTHEIRVGGSVGGNQNLSSGVCEGVNVELVDYLGLPSNAASDVNIKLENYSDSMKGLFGIYSDAACTQPTLDLTISSGSSSKVLYFKGFIQSTGSRITFNPLNQAHIAKVEKNIVVNAGTAVKLGWYWQSPHQEYFNSVTATQCSPRMSLVSVDSAGNWVTASSSVIINLTAEKLDINGLPAGVGQPQSGVSFYSDSSCQNQITSVVVTAGQEISDGFYFKTNFGREQFAVIATAPFASTYAIMSAGVDKMAFTQAPTFPSEEAFACRSFTIQHQNIATGEPINPESKVVIEIEVSSSTLMNFDAKGEKFSIGGSSALLYKNSDCSDSGSSYLSSEITSLPGTPTNGEVAAHVTKTFYIKTFSLSQETIRITAAGRLGASLLINSMVPANSRLVFDNPALKSIEAGVCSGTYYRGIDSISKARLRGRLLTSPLTGSRTIYGGGNSVIDLNSERVSFFADEYCTTPISSVRVNKYTGHTQNIYYRVEKSGPNEFSGTGQVTSEISGITGRSVIEVTPGPVQRIGFGSSPQTLRAGDCSDSLDLQTQDQFGNESADVVSNEVSFIYPSGFVVYESLADCEASTNSIATTNIPLNQSRKSVWFRHQFAGTAEITPRPIRSYQGIPQVQTILANTASLLKITSSAQTLPVAVCSSPVALQIQDNLGNPVPASADTTVTAVGENGVGYMFYTNSNCSPSSATTEVTIASGSSAATIYFMAFKTGSSKITFKAAGLVDARQSQNILKGLPESLSFSSLAYRTQAGKCSGEVQLAFMDRLGQETAVVNSGTLNLTGGASYYSNDNCSVAITSLTTSMGDLKKSFYYKSTTAGDIDLIVTDPSVGGLGSAVQTHEITAIAPDSLKFINSPTSTIAGKCSNELKIGAFDIYGNASKVSQASLLYTLSVTGGLELYKDQSCTTVLPANQNVIPVNESESSFYVKSSVLGSKTMTTSNNRNLFEATQVATITAGLPTKLGFVNAPKSIGTGECSATPYTLMTTDSFDYETPAIQNYTIDLTPPAGGQFFSSAGCLGGTEISSTSIASGSSRSAPLYLKVPTIIGSYTISVSTPSGLTANSQAVTVVPGVPSALRFISSAQSDVKIETCSARVDIGMQDAYGYSVSSLGPKTISLSSAQGTFFSDAACSTSISSVNFGNGENAKSFYYKPNQVGNIGLNLAASGMTGASQTHISVAGSGAKLVFSSVPHSMTAGQCRLATIELQDSLNNPSNTTSDRTIALASSGSAATFYSTADCSGAPVVSKVLSSGNSSTYFSFVVTASGSSSLTASAAGLAQAQQTQTIQPEVSSKWSFVTPARTITAGDCSSQVTFQSQDLYSNPAVVLANTTVSLTSSELSFYSDALCGTPIATIEVASGTHSGTLYFKSTKSGSWPLTISGGTFAAINQNQIVQSAAVSKLVYLNTPLNQVTGSCGLLSMQFQDSFNNPVSLSSALTVTYQLSGVTSQIYSNAGCSSAITNQVVSSGSDFMAYFKSNLTGVATVRISASGVALADQTQTLFAGLPSLLSFVSSALTLDSGQCSSDLGPTIVQVQDSLGNASGVLSPSVLGLSGAGYTFYSDVGCVTPISQVNLSTGAHTASFYFKKVIAGSSQIVASMAGFTNSQQAQTVNALPLSKVGMNPPSQTIASAACAPVQVQTQDSNGNPVARAANTSVNLSVTAGAIGIYSNAGCSTPISSVVIPSGSASAPLIYVKSNVSGVAVVEASDAAAILNSGTQTITVSAGSASAIAFETGSFSTTAGQCSAKITIRSKDGFGNITNVATNSTINLTATPVVVPAANGVIYYSDSGCTSSVTAVTIAAGTSSVDVYFKALKTNNYTLSAAGLTTATQSQLVTAAPVVTLAITSGANQSLAAGTCSGALTIESRDTYGNASRPASNYNFALAGTNLNFFSDSGCTSSISNTTITSASTASSFYYRSTVVGIYTLSITGPVSTSTNATIVPGTPVQLSLEAPVTELYAGSCSGVIRVRSKDAYGHYSSLSTTETVSLALSPDRGQLYSDFGCVTALASNQVNIGAGSSQSQSLYFKNAINETVSLQASLAGFSPSTVNIDVTAAGPLLQLFSQPANTLYNSGGLFEFNLRSVDTEQSFFVKNNGVATSGVLTVSLIEDLVNPTGGSATMWSLKSDLCSGNTLAPAATCLVTVEFRALSGSKPSGDFYYSNLRVQSAPVATGQTTIDLRFSGIK